MIGNYRPGRAAISTTRLESAAALLTSASILGTVILSEDGPYKCPSESKDLAVSLLRRAESPALPHMTEQGRRTKPEHGGLSVEAPSFSWAKKSICRLGFSPGALQITRCRPLRLRCGQASGLSRASQAEVCRTAQSQGPTAKRQEQFFYGRVLAISGTASRGGVPK